jgi:hypothetical protein
LRCRGQHAFSTDPEERDVAREMLQLFDLHNDDAVMAELMVGWRTELYKARALYTSAIAVEGPVLRWNGLSFGSISWPWKSVPRRCAECTTAWSQRGSCPRMIGHITSYSRRSCACVGMGSCRGDG